MHGYLFGGKCSPTRPYYALHVFYLDHFLEYYVHVFASLPIFFLVIQDFLSFGYCDALKDGLARTVKVFSHCARTSLLLSTGVPSMQTWPIIRNERRFQLLHCF